LVQIRDATPDEMAEVGEIRVIAYQAGGFLSPDSGYAPALRELGADGKGHVLVAVLPDEPPAADGVAEGGAGGPGSGRGGSDDPAGRGEPGGRVVGTIMLQTWPNAGHVVTGPQEAEIRALAVMPDVQGRGVGA